MKTVRSPYKEGRRGERDSRILNRLFALLVIGDSRKMLEVADRTVALAVTSPPYWSLDIFSRPEEPGSQHDLSRITEKHRFFEEIKLVWREVYRTLKPGGYFAIEFEDYPVGSRVYGYPRELFLADDMHRSIEASGLYLISRWIWRKAEPGIALSKFPYTLYDAVRAGGRNDPRAIANWAYVFVYKKYGPPRSGSFERADWARWSDGVWSDLPPAESGSEEKYGISGGAVFPDELVARLLRIYSRPGDVILDPFLGTGTTMRVALRLGRSCIGYECLEKMLPVIKAKVGWGQVRLTGPQIEYKLVRHGESG